MSKKGDKSHTNNFCHLPTFYGGHKLRSDDDRARARCEAKTKTNLKLVLTFNVYTYKFKKNPH